MCARKPIGCVSGEKITSNEPIELDKEMSEIRKEPYSLPDGFQWDTLNLDEPLVLKEVYTLLNENYVEDDDSMFRFDYPPDFLKWLVLIVERRFRSAVAEFDRRISVNCLIMLFIVNCQNLTVSH